MPQRSKVEQLPPEVRIELDRRLAGNAFSRFDELSAWLQSVGYSISSSAIGVHSKKLQEMRKRVDVQKAVTEAVAADGASYIMGIAYAVASKLEDVLEIMQLEPDEEGNGGIDATQISKLARAAADLQKVITSGDIHKIKMRELMQKQLDELEAQARRENMSAYDAIQHIRQLYFGLGDQDG